MTYIVLGFVAVVAIIFVGVVIGKSIDKRVEELIGKDEIKDQKKKRRLQQKAVANGTENKKVLGNILRSMVIDEVHECGPYFDK